MNITPSTPRRHTVNIVNDDFTLYNYDRQSRTYSAPVKVERIYAEWSKANLERKYGVGTEYKGLIVIDGTKNYVSQPATGFFTLTVGDKIVPMLTDLSIEAVIEQGLKLYEVKEVSIYTMSGFLLSVEVLCG